MNTFVAKQGAVKDRIINKIATEQMLRYLPGTKARHTIKRPIQVEKFKPRSATDAFLEYTKDVIPRIEESIEKRLIYQYMEKLGTPMEKEEVMEAYKIRKVELAKLDQQQVAYVSSPDYSAGFMDGMKAEIVTPSPEILQDFKNLISSAEGQGMTYHTYEDIGKYTIFPKSHWKRMFPRDSCGLFDEIDFKSTNTYGVMCTEESLKLTYQLSHKHLPKDRKIDYEGFIKSGQDIKEIIKDEQTFMEIYQDFSLDLLDTIKERNTQAVRNVYESPSIFDGVVGVLIRELRKKTIKNFLLHKTTRKQIMNEITDMLLNLFEEKDIHLRELKHVIEHCRILEVNLNRADLGHLAEYAEMSGDNKKYKIYLQGHQKYCYHFWRPEDMREHALQNFKGFNTG